MNRHMVASVIVISKFNNEWKVLMIKHKKLMKWVVPGGHIELNETPIDAAKREVLEETALEKINFLSFMHKKIDDFENVKWELPPEFCFIEKIPKNSKEESHEHIDYIYVAIVNSCDVKLNSNEADDIKWFSVDELNCVDVFSMTKYCSVRVIENIEKLTYTTF